jgi:hypothetical protein
MMPAEQQTVLEAGLSSVGPMLHVMRVGEATPAPWEATPAIAHLERATDGRRRRARLPSHVEDVSVGTVSDFDQTRVAGEPAGSFS